MLNFEFLPSNLYYDLFKSFDLDGSNDLDITEIYRFFCIKLVGLNQSVIIKLHNLLKKTFLIVNHDDASNSLDKYKF